MLRRLSVNLKRQLEIFKHTWKQTHLMLLQRRILNHAWKSSWSRERNRSRKRRTSQRFKRSSSQLSKKYRLRKALILTQMMLQKKQSHQHQLHKKAQETNSIKRHSRKQKIRLMKSRQSQLLNKFLRLWPSLRSIGILLRTKMMISLLIFRIYPLKQLSPSLKSQKFQLKFSVEFSKLYRAMISSLKLIRIGLANFC